MTAVLAAIMLVLMAGGFLYLKIRVDKVVSGEEWIRKIRDEIDQLVLEMNQTAERNVALLENRVKALQKLLDEADKKLIVMQKESEKTDLSRQVYTHLKKQQIPPSVDKGGKSSDEENLTLFDDLSPSGSSKPSVSVKKEESSLKDKVIDLYSQGFSSEIISQKLKASISEVDLIINLNTGQGGPG